MVEIDATLTNLDGVEQRAIAGGKLPGDARPGWRVLRALGGELKAAGFGFSDLAGANIGQQRTGAEIDLGGLARRKVQSKRDLGGDRRGQLP